MYTAMTIALGVCVACNYSFEAIRKKPNWNQAHIMSIKQILVLLITITNMAILQH